MSGAATLERGSGHLLGMRLPVIGAFAAFVMFVLAAYRQTALGMIHIWFRSETFNHCFLILPIVLWLVWQRRASLQSVSAAPSPWALIPLALSGVGWLAGHLARVDVLTHFAVTAMLVTLVPLVFGSAVARFIAFPLAFMFLAVPFGEFAMPWMMERTADFTVGALALSGIPVYREGLHFVIPSGNWSVVEACSGVRYLIASFTVGSLFAYLNYRSLGKRLAFVAVSILVPIVANWLRAYMIVMLGHLSSNRLAAGVDHLIYGWVFFGVVIMVMFAIGARFSDDPIDGEANMVPTRDVDGIRAPGAIATAMVYLAAAGLIAVPAAAGQALMAAGSTGVPSLSLPTAFGPWSGEPAPPDGWVPAFERPTRDWKGRFVSSDGTVDVYLGYYRRQSDGGKVVGSGSVLVKSGDDKWLQSSGGMASARIFDKMRDVRAATLASLDRTAAGGAQRLLVWYFYWVDGHLTANEFEVKARIAWSMINGGGDDATVVVFSTPAGSGASARLQSFLDASASGLIDAVSRAGQGR